MDNHAETQSSWSATTMHGSPPSDHTPQSHHRDPNDTLESRGHTLNGHHPPPHPHPHHYRPPPQQQQYLDNEPRHVQPRDSSGPAPHPHPRQHQHHQHPHANDSSQGYPSTRPVSHYNHGSGHPNGSSSAPAPEPVTPRSNGEINHVHPPNARHGPEDRRDYRGDPTRGHLDQTTTTSTSTSSSSSTTPSTPNGHHPHSHTRIHSAPHSLHPHTSDPVGSVSHHPNALNRYPFSIPSISAKLDQPHHANGSDALSSLWKKTTPLQEPYFRTRHTIADPHTLSTLGGVLFSLDEVPGDFNKDMYIAMRNRIFELEAKSINYSPFTRPRKRSVDRAGIEDYPGHGRSTHEMDAAHYSKRPSYHYPPQPSRGAEGDHPPSPIQRHHHSYPSWYTPDVYSDGSHVRGRHPSERERDYRPPYEHRSRPTSPQPHPSSMPLPPMRSAYSPPPSGSSPSNAQPGRSSTSQSNHSSHPPHPHHSGPPVPTESRSHHAEERHPANGSYPPGNHSHGHGPPQHSSHPHHPTQSPHPSQHHSQSHPQPQQRQPSQAYPPPQHHPQHPHQPQLAPAGSTPQTPMSNATPQQRQSFHQQQHRAQQQAQSAHSRSYHLQKHMRMLDQQRAAQLAQQKQAQQAAQQQQQGKQHPQQQGQPPKAIQRHYQPHQQMYPHHQQPIAIKPHPAPQQQQQQPVQASQQARQAQQPNGRPQQQQLTQQQIIQRIQQHRQIQLKQQQLRQLQYMRNRPSAPYPTQKTAQTLAASPGSHSPTPPRVFGPQVDRPIKKSTRPLECANCMALDSLTWRPKAELQIVTPDGSAPTTDNPPAADATNGSGDNKILCPACTQYLQLHGKSRPVPPFRTNFLKKIHTRFKRELQEVRFQGWQDAQVLEIEDRMVEREFQMVFNGLDESDAAQVRSRQASESTRASSSPAPAIAAVTTDPPSATVTSTASANATSDNKKESVNGASKDKGKIIIKIEDDDVTMSLSKSKPEVIEVRTFQSEASVGELFGHRWRTEPVVGYTLVHFGGSDRTRMVPMNPTVPSLTITFNRTTESITFAFRVLVNGLCLLSSGGGPPALHMPEMADDDDSEEDEEEVVVVPDNDKEDPLSSPSADTGNNSTSAKDGSLAVVELEGAQEATSEMNVDVPASKGSS